MAFEMLDAVKCCNLQLRFTKLFYDLVTSMLVTHIPWVFWEEVVNGIVQWDPHLGMRYKSALSGAESLISYCNMLWVKSRYL